jgi:hypothetical protein
MRHRELLRVSDWTVLMKKEDIELSTAVSDWRSLKSDRTVGQALQEFGFHDEAEAIEAYIDSPSRQDDWFQKNVVGIEYLHKIVDKSGLGKEIT